MSSDSYDPFEPRRETSKSPGAAVGQSDNLDSFGQRPSTLDQASFTLVMDRLEAIEKRLAELESLGSGNWSFGGLKLAK